MAILVGVALISAGGWLFSLGLRSSAARRHLVLGATLAACWLLPLAWGVRSGTNWTLLAIRGPLDAGNSDENARPVGIASSERMVSWRSPEEPMDSLSSDLGLAQPIRHDATDRNRQNSSAVSRAEDGQDAGIGQRRSFQQDGRRPTAAADWQAVAKRWGKMTYTVVAAALLLRLLVGLASVQRVKRRALEVDTLAGGIPVLVGDVAVPSAVGFGRRAIVLPRGFRETAAPLELQDVLTHEAEHLRRGDHWVMLLQELLSAIYWPIVTIHLLNRALTRAREELCDNAVLVLRDPVAYGQTLLRVAEQMPRRRSFATRLAPSVIGRGALERRVAALLDDRRDRRTRVGRRVRWTMAAGLVVAFTLAGTTRVVAVADEPRPDESASETFENETPAPSTDIEWTGIPRVDRDDATLHRGVVLGPDGKPLAGASVYAASTIELLELAEADDVGVNDLGPVRAVTDAEGRFEFTAPDLSWVTPAGVRKRWETLLVATKEGVPPGWLKTWGEDRSFREHWHPHLSREVAVRTRQPESLTGRLLLEGGTPLVDARIRLTGLMAPVEYDLDRHIPQEEEAALGLFATIDYAETLYRPRLLPEMTTEATTDKEGRFELPGLPEGFIAQLEVTHPEAVTTSLRAAVRSIGPVYRKPFGGRGEPSLTLYGSGFAVELPRGIVLRGRVVSSDGFSTTSAVGVTVALANHNARDGMMGQRFQTNGDGRFEVTGLPPHAQGYELAFVGSFAAPYGSQRQRIMPGEDATVKLYPAVPFRLKLTDPQGNPVDRKVHSLEVQERPGEVRREVKARFNDAERVAPGLYEGIVPTGPAAVVVKRGAKSDRPAAVDPKGFFAPGRTDWTLEEERYAYGDAWRIAEPAVSTTDVLAVNGNPTQDQLELAAAVLTNARTEDGVLDLTAVVHSDPPVDVTLIDEAGQPVANARVERRFTSYNGKGLPTTFPVYGLHPERAELLVFQHEERDLVGTLSAAWTSEPIQVVMRPAAKLTGRLVDKSGSPDFDFAIRLLGERMMPDTFVVGRTPISSDKPGERPGEFRVMVPPGEAVRGEFVRRTADRVTRPSAGTAFGPLTLDPGETLDLGDLTAP